MVKKEKLTAVCLLETGNCVCVRARRRRGSGVQQHGRLQYIQCKRGRGLTSPAPKTSLIQYFRCRGRPSEHCSQWRRKRSGVANTQRPEWKLKVEEKSLKERKKLQLKKREKFPRGVLSHTAKYNLTSRPLRFFFFFFNSNTFVFIYQRGGYRRRYYFTPARGECLF